MNRLKLGYTIVLSLLWGLIALGQGTSITVTGRVLDDAHTALPQANVKLLRADGHLMTGTTTDQSGQFRLTKAPAGRYTLEVSFVGFTPNRQTLTLTTQKPEVRLKDIILQEDKKMLSEVKVIGKANEIVVKGDTIEYNAGSYTTSKGAALEELIKKLPGAEINESGEITINGKSVSKIMVDGKRFFESDPKVALKNLPADLIDKVQVLDRESDASRMTGFADGDEETVLNLTVKKGSKKGLFGTSYVGGSLDLERYEANATLNRFSEGKQWSVVAGANNTNNAGSSDIASNSGSGSFGGGGRGRGGMFGGSANNGITSSWIVGGNLANMLDNNRGEIGAGTTLGYGDHITTSKHERTDILSNGSTTERGSTNNRQRKYNTGANLRLEWKPSDKTTLILSPQLNYGTNAGEHAEEAITYNDTDASVINTNKLSQITDNKTLNARLNADFSQRLSDRGRTIAISLMGGYNANLGDGTYQSELDNRLKGQKTIVDQYLDNANRSFNYRARLSYVEPIGKGYAVQLLYQLHGDETRSHRFAYDRDGASGRYDQLNKHYSTEFSSSFFSHRIGLAVKKSNKVYDITAGINFDPSHLHSYTEAGNQTRPIDQYTFNFSPSLRLRYKPSRSFDLNLDYRGRSFQPTANQLSPIQDNTNPLVVYEGNPDLKPGYRHNLFGRFSSFRAKSQSSLSLFAHLQYVQNDIVSRAIYDRTSGVRTIGYTNVEGNFMLGFGGFYSTPLPGKRFSLRLGGFNMLGNQVGFIDGERNEALSLRLSPSATLAYRYEWLDTSLKGSWGYHRVFNSLPQAQGQTTQDYRIDWDANIKLPLGFAIEHQLAYRTSDGYSSGYDRDQTLINLGLSYSFGASKAATIRLKAYDLLNQRSNIFRNVTALSSTMQETNTLGRYVMLHFIYQFNRFSGNASAADMRQVNRGGRHPHAML